MGLYDRDYMRERARERRRVQDVPSWMRSDETPRDGNRRALLWQLLTWLCVIYLLFKVFSWWETRRLEARSTEQPPESEATNKAPERRAPLQPTQVQPSGKAMVPRAPVPAASQPIELGRGSVSTGMYRCESDGKISFTDQPCPAGVDARHIVVRSSPGVAVTEAPPAATARSAPPAANYDQSTAALPDRQPDMVRKAQCEHHEEAIRTIDQLARQPLSGQEQDRLASNRKFHRNQQYRLKC